MARLERVRGIEPRSTGWKPVALPLSYTRESTQCSVRGHGYVAGFPSAGSPAKSVGCDSHATVVVCTPDQASDEDQTFPVGRMPGWPGGGRTQYTVQLFGPVENLSADGI